MTTSASQPDPNQPRRFLQPCLLLLIAESPSHGYDLMDRLAAFRFERDPGTLYRTLRWMEQRGLVRSQWVRRADGPGRRRYELTNAGHDELRSGAQALDETRGMLDAFLMRYEKVRPVSPAPTVGRTGKR